VKLIEPGRKVSVTVRGGRSIKGRMQTWSPDAVAVLQGKDKVVRVPKDEVSTLAMVVGLSRAKRAGYAAAIGGASGAALFGALCAGDDDCDVSPSLVAAGAAIWIGGIAAGVAALIPQHKEVIYRSAPAKP
jgi:hypothetical protein